MHYFTFLVDHGHSFKFQDEGLKVFQPFPACPSTRIIRLFEAKLNIVAGDNTCNGGILVQRFKSSRVQELGF